MGRYGHGEGRIQTFICSWLNIMSTLASQSHQDPQETCLMAFLKVLFDCTEVMRQSYSLYLGLYLTSHEMVLGLNLQGFWGGEEELRH